MNMIVWQEFTKSGSITTKRKSFKSAAELERFTQRLFDKDNFYKIIAYC